MNSILAVFGMGGTELIVIFGAILILFGAKRIPEFAKGLGQGIKEFKKATKDVTEEVHKAMEESPAPQPQRRLPANTEEQSSTIGQQVSGPKA